MSEVGKIIAKHRKENGISQGEMLLKLSSLGYQLKKSAYSAWETGASQPSAEQFLAVCKILGITDIYNEFIGGFNAVDPMAQLNDEGKLKALEYIHLLVISGQYTRKEPTVITPMRDLRLYEMPVSAGNGNFLDGDDYETIQVGNEVPIKTDFGVRISGNSMQPRYLDKQIIWIQQTESLLDGEIGIFFLNGNAYCKKLQNNAKGLSLISLNPEYSPILVKEQDELKVFGRVLN